ncbi:MAG: RNA polymerase sigma factor [Saprospiraceae bacterium]|nr:RNA polymerase sigma factor [Saprospiraceae bacterium]
MSNQQDLFRRLIEEEEAAFKEVYRIAYRPVASYVKNNGGKEEDLQDVFQDGLIGLIKLLRKPSFVATASVTTLMFSICRNTWLKMLRRKGREIPAEEFPPGIQPIEVPDLEDKEQQHTETYQSVEAALDIMNGDCKTIVLKAHYEGKSAAEIGQLFDIAEGTARVRLFRCMNKLRKILKEKFNLDL